MITLLLLHRILFSHELLLPIFIINLLLSFIHFKSLKLCRLFITVSLCQGLSIILFDLCQLISIFATLGFDSLFSVLKIVSWILSSFSWKHFMDWDTVSFYKPGCFNVHGDLGNFMASFQTNDLIRKSLGMVVVICDHGTQGTEV